MTQSLSRTDDRFLSSVFAGDRPQKSMVCPTLLCTLLVASLQAQTPTFTKDIAPILQKSCQNCHRPGEAAPFSLLTYEQARPWAKAIRAAVVQRKMPPWFADPHYGKFLNDSSLTYEQARPWAKAIRAAVVQRKMPPWFADPHYGKFLNDSSLPQSEINTVTAWADGGAPQGNPKDMPPPRDFADGWAIPKPDAVIELPSAYEIPATGTIEYQHILIPAPFKTDRWVQFAEARPTDRSHVHHIIAFIR